VVVVLTPFAITFYVFFPEYLDETTSVAATVAEEVVINTIVFAAYAILNSYLLWIRGQTIGKLLLKTQILSEQNELVPVVRVLLIRYLLILVISSLPGIGRLFAFANSLAIFRENHKCLHDEICKTKVVQYAPFHETPVEKY